MKGAREGKPAPAGTLQVSVHTSGQGESLGARHLLKGPPLILLHQIGSFQYMGEGEHVQAGATNLVLWLGYEVCPILLYIGRSVVNGWILT